jgi:hypothetical protein
MKKRKIKVSKKKLRKIAAGLNALSGELYDLSQGSGTVTIDSSDFLTKSGSSYL